MDVRALLIEGDTWGGKPEISPLLGAQYRQFGEESVKLVGWG